VMADPGCIFPSRQGKTLFGPRKRALQRHKKPIYQQLKLSAARLPAAEFRRRKPRSAADWQGNSARGLRAVPIAPCRLSCWHVCRGLIKLIIDLITSPLHIGAAPPAARGRIDRGRLSQRVARYAVTSLICSAVRSFEFSCMISLARAIDANASNWRAR